MSDYSGNGGIDLFKSDVLSPSSQKETGSPFGKTSRDISREEPSLHKPDANSSKLHPRVILPIWYLHFEQFDAFLK